MYIHYLKIIIRTFLRNKVISAINILGLTLGLMACIFIGLYSQYEFSYDSFFPDSENIYRLGAVYNFPGRPSQKRASAPTAAKDVIAKEFPQISKVIHIAGFPGDSYFTFGNSSYSGKLWQTSIDFFDFFKFDLIAQSSLAPISNLTSIAISRRVSEKIFGDKYAIGEVLSVEKRGQKNKVFVNDYEVSVVFENIPDNSHFDFDYIILENPNQVLESLSWARSQATFTYFKMVDNKGVSLINSRLSSIVNRYSPLMEIGTDPSQSIELFIESVKDIHLSDVPPEDGFKPNGNHANLVVLSLVAVLILIVASINFMNISLVRSLGRMREVGIRKVVGATRGQIFYQFLLENFLYAVIALIIALALVELLLPSFNSLLGRELFFNYQNNFSLFVAFSAIIVVLTIVGGAYPAIIVAAVRPIEVIRSSSARGYFFGAKSRAGGVLVIFQFAVSSAMIISAVGVYQQQNFTENLDLGFARENKLLISGFFETNKRKIEDTLTRDLLQVSGVKSVSYSAHNFSGKGNWLNFGGIQVPGVSSVPNVYAIPVSSNFLDVFQVRLMAGRNFDIDSHRDEFVRENRVEGVPLKFSIILNELAVKELGFINSSEALNTVIRMGRDDALIIGIVKDHHIQSLRDKIKPMIYMHRKDYARFNTIVNYHKNADLTGLIKDLELVWRKYYHSRPFNYSFLEENIQSQYSSNKSMLLLLAIFSGLGIIVSCLGLYSMSVFVVSLKTKEIGIRKVLGATTVNILLLVGRQFMIPIVIANLISWPVAWYFLTDYLSEFEYRISLDVSYFVVTGLITLAFACLASVRSVVKVASISPINALKEE